MVTQNVAATSSASLEIEDTRSDEPEADDEKQGLKAPSLTDQTGAEPISITFTQDGPLGIGLKERKGGGGVLISSVEPSSPAAVVPVGTQLAEVDGQDAGEMNKAAVINAIKAAKLKGDFTIVFGKPNVETSL